MKWNYMDQIQRLWKGIFLCVWKKDYKLNICWKIRKKNANSNALVKFFLFFWKEEAKNQEILKNSIFIYIYLLHKLLIECE